MSASTTTQEISEIEARLYTIEDVLIRLHGLLGCLLLLDNPVEWKDQVQKLHKETERTGKACIAAFSLHAVDLEATTSETDIVLRRLQAERRAAMQSARKAGES